MVVLSVHKTELQKACCDPDDYNPKLHMLESILLDILDKYQASCVAAIHSCPAPVYHCCTGSLNTQARCVIDLQRRYWTALLYRVAEHQESCVTALMLHYCTRPMNAQASSIIAIQSRHCTSLLYQVDEYAGKLR